MQKVLTYGFPSLLNQSAIFTAGIVLLLNIWGGKRSGLSTDPNKVSAFGGVDCTRADICQEMADVHKAMKCLKSIENGYVFAGASFYIR